jgi:hypothetical protein
MARPDEDGVRRDHQSEERVHCDHKGFPGLAARRHPFIDHAAHGYLILGAMLIAVTAVLGGPTTTPTAAAATTSPNT